MAFPTGWSAPYEIQSDNTKVSGSSNHTDIPLLIKDGNLSSSVYAGLKSDASDLRITTDQAGTTEIPFEIVSFSQAGKTCEIWAKVPTLSYNSNTSLFIWYGNASAVAYDASAPFGSQAVWSAYSYVGHMENASTDSTTNANNGADTSITYPAGVVGDSAEFNGSSVISLGTSATLNHSTITLQTWFTTDDASTDQSLIAKWTSPYQYSFRINGSNKVAFYIRAGGGTRGPVTSSTTISTTTWYHAVATYDGSNLRLYINGSADGTPVAYSGTLNSTTVATLLGKEDTALGLLDGKLDEVRVQSTVRSADWIATEYNNQNAPSTFWIPGRRIFVIG